MDSNKKNRWSGLFNAPLDIRAARFNASINFDYRLAKYDIAASLAHADMLAAQGIINADDGEAIQRGLSQIMDEVAAGTFEWREQDEDIHFSIERRLVELIGDVGKRLHTARSRNDQVATDLRLFLRESIDNLQHSITRARHALLEKANAHADTLMAGFTHLQVAQPITLGHHLLAYDDMLQRDAERFADCRRRLNYLPLGAGALAGVGYPIDRLRVARALQFDGVCENSLDAVSDRDFAIEFCAAGALLMIHLSRFCEEAIMWCSSPFACAALSDAFCTGSSIMPQKKNPDIPELIRGKSGRVSGHLIALLMLMKAQPLAYNKDNQEDKEGIFDCVDTLQNCVDIFAAMIDAMQFLPQQMRKLLDSGYPTATELADYLTKSGMPFRAAHEVVAVIVKDCIKKQLRLEELSLEALRVYIPEANEDTLKVLRVDDAIRLRCHVGGSAPEEVKRQIARRQAALARQNNNA